MNYWMLTLSEGNFAVTRQQHWKVQGFTTPQRRKVERIQQGDRLLLYVREPRGFGLTATVTGRFFEERSVFWRNHRPEETFPYRVRIRPDAILREGEYVEAMDLAPRLEYIRRWAPERWLEAFIGELHLLPRKDFELIEGEIRRLRRQPMPQTSPMAEAASVTPAEGAEEHSAN